MHMHIHLHNIHIHIHILALAYNMHITYNMYHTYNTFVCVLVCPKMRYTVYHIPQFYGLFNPKPPDYGGSSST